MTKAEYESSTAIIIADNKLGHTNRMIELRYIDAEYIESLEAENAALIAMNKDLGNQPLMIVKPPEAEQYEQALAAKREYSIAVSQLMKDNEALEAKNAKLEKALNKAAVELERQSLDCPRTVYPDFDNNCCIGFPMRDEATCWREWLMGGENGKD